MAVNYLRYLNSVSLARKPSPIRKLTEILANSPPSMISLAGGMPNSATFPFQECEIRTKDGNVLKLGEKDMKVALQYCPSQGLGSLIDWLKALQMMIHAPPLWKSKTENSTELDLIVTSGSQDGLCKAMEMMLSKGDNVLMDTPAYPGTLAILRPLGTNILAVKSDHDGMIPESLEEILSQWSPEDAEDPSSDIPKVLIVIPNAGNPSGSTLPLERRKKIYEIAQKYNLLIVEDDPYFYLQFSKPYLPSFMSMDVDGRVLRSDSFSKILSSGLRVGFLTGPKPLLQRLTLHMQVSVMHCSAMSQMMILSFLQQHGHHGFLEHVDRVTDFYRSQKEKAVSAANTHLHGLAEWAEPKGGMFLWIKVPGLADTKSMIEEKAMAKEVLLVPGCVFEVDEAAPSQYLRAAFSVATGEQIDEAFQRLKVLIEEELASAQK